MSFTGAAGWLEPIHKKRMIRMNLLLMSNQTNYGQSPLEHVRNDLLKHVGNRRRITFFGFAHKDVVAYTEAMTAVFKRFGLETFGIHETSNPHEEIARAEILYVGGGNTFRLIKSLYDLNLIEVLREKLIAGTPYMGDSAGSIIAGPSISTTNDMPVVEPVDFRALNVIPFHINPHYVSGRPYKQFMGETRDERIADFLEEKSVPVLAMWEGSWLRINDDETELRGPSSAFLFNAGGSIQNVPSGSDLSALRDYNPS